MAALEQIVIPRPHEQNDPNEDNNMPAEEVERAQQHDEAINDQDEGIDNPGDSSDDNDDEENEQWFQLYEFWNDGMDDSGNSSDDSSDDDDDDSSDDDDDDSSDDEENQQWFQLYEFWNDGMDDSGNSSGYSSDDDDDDSSDDDDDDFADDDDDDSSDDDDDDSSDDEENQQWLAQPHNPPNTQHITRSPTTPASDVNGGPAQSEENPVMVHNHGTQMPGGLPLQESGDGEMLYPQSAQVGSNTNIMVHDPVAASASEDELVGVIIAVQLLVMSVDTVPAIVAEL